MKIRSNAISGILWIGIWIVSSAVVLKLDGIVQRDYGISLIPFGIISLMAFVLCVVYACKLKRTRFKLLLAYISVIPLCVCMGEVYLWCMDKVDIIEPNKTLGFAPKKSYSLHRKIMIDNQIIYDVTYTTDTNGLRTTTNNNTDSNKCINFYGGSFTFGSGLNDNQTLPSLLAKQLKNYRVLNYGIGGGGAHTMLARLEFNIDKNIWSKCRESVTFYIAIPHHIYRVFGVLRGPKYELENNKAIYKGTFTQKDSAKIWEEEQQKVSFSITQRFTNQLEKSYIAKRFEIATAQTESQALLKQPLFKNGYASNPDFLKLNQTDDLKLYFSVLHQAKNELLEKYNSELIVILWDNDMHAEFLTKYDSAIKDFLINEKIRFYTLSEIIPDYSQDLQRVQKGDFEHFKYRISRWDTHPNALANELIAQYIATRIQSGAIELTKIPNNKRDSSLDSSAIKSKE